MHVSNMPCSRRHYPRLLPAAGHGCRAHAALACRTGRLPGSRGSGHYHVSRAAGKIIQHLLHGLLCHFVRDGGCRPRFGRRDGARVPTYRRRPAGARPRRARACDSANEAYAGAGPCQPPARAPARRLDDSPFLRSSRFGARRSGFRCGRRDWEVGGRRWRAGADHGVEYIIVRSMRGRMRARLSLCMGFLRLLHAGG